MFLSKLEEYTPLNKTLLPVNYHRMLERRLVKYDPIMRG